VRRRRRAPPPLLSLVVVRRSLLSRRVGEASSPSFSFDARSITRPHDTTTNNNNNNNNVRRLDSSFFVHNPQHLPPLSSASSVRRKEPTRALLPNLAPPHFSLTSIVRPPPLAVARHAVVVPRCSPLPPFDPSFIDLKRLHRRKIVALESRYFGRAGHRASCRMKKKWKKVVQQQQRKCPPTKKGTRRRRGRNDTTGRTTRKTTTTKTKTKERQDDDGIWSNPT